MKDIYQNLFPEDWRKDQLLLNFDYKLPKSEKEKK